MTTTRQYDAVLLFTGHMTDGPDREIARFPPDAEKAAAHNIRELVAAWQQRNVTSVLGVASGARGGDILFHESCQNLAIPTILVLPFEVEQFKRESVSGSPFGNWEQRFRDLLERIPHVILARDETDPFGTCNRAMLDMARDMSKNVELLALWDGVVSGKAGGTDTFVKQAIEAGCPIIHLDMRTVLADAVEAGR